MLSGIRTGKKKRKARNEDVSDANEPSVRDAESKRPAAVSNDGNLSAAEQLRRQLASGGLPERPGHKNETDESSQLLLRLQRQGRIAKELGESENNNDNNVVVVTGSAAAAQSSRLGYRTEDFRHGSRKGKLKKTTVDVAGTTKDEAEMSIQDMLEAERQNKQSMDELFARNVARVGSRYKGKDFAAASSTGADEEDAVDMTMFSSQRLTTVASQQKERSRQLATHDRDMSITSKCWWWMESTSFRKHMLIALGNHVSLSMAPAHLSLIPGDHLYLVPIQHAEALVGCEDDVWNEISRFQSSLRAMYAKEGKGVLFTETVLPSTTGLWQTRMEATPVPNLLAKDSPMFFKSALTEQAEEWGTHTKLLSTRDRGLRRTIPKKFPYFFIDWEQGDGYAQIIETSSFPRDFGADTIAGMLELDPVRFRRKQTQSPADERKLVLDFLQKWKPFDWTLDLD